ncbi:MAG: MerR family transcriptional regulator [Lachnospiraceae bacterium]|nr:MerR family transcriptional regulator [Lachnospiraceae bacterium]
MDKKMTSGEIAKAAGVSQKAVRLYDEKGLLKPADYSEGNYRLYDEASLQILEKIVALKQIGFSLEEIRDNLVAGDAVDIEEALRIQLKNMEEKRYQIQKVIDAINRTFDRKDDNKLDWDDVALMVQNISLDQKADERHWNALKHTAAEEDWYEKIFRSLNIKENEKVLDLGCGFAKLWRNNWSVIPKGTKVFGVDVHGSWEDNFAGFIDENKDSLPEGVEISLDFNDLEEEKSWDKINADQKYSLIVAHYIDYQLKNPEALVERASKVLDENGIFSFNGGNISNWNYFFKDVLEEIGVKTDFIDAKIADQTAKNKAMREMLERHFGKVEPVKLTNRWHYDSADDLFDKMIEYLPDNTKLFEAKYEKIKSVFAQRISDKGEIVVELESQFWHCCY